LQSKWLLSQAQTPSSIVRQLLFLELFLRVDFVLSSCVGVVFSLKRKSTGIEASDQLLPLFGMKRGRGRGSKRESQNSVTKCRI
jgi:hypothetical protein